MKKQVWAVTTLFLSLGLMACSKGMNTQTSSPSTQEGSKYQDTFSESELTALEKSVDESVVAAEQAILEAQDALNGIFDKNGKLKSASHEEDFQAQLFISGKVEEALDKVKVSLDKIPEAFDLARSKLTEAMGKLDPNNPAHQALIAKVMTLMGKIDVMESKVSTLKQVLVSKINLIIKKLDILIATMSSNVLGAILVFELQDIRQVIVNFRDSIK